MFASRGIVARSLTLPLLASSLLVSGCGRDVMVLLGNAEPPSGPDAGLLDADPGDAPLSDLDAGPGDSEPGDIIVVPDVGPGDGFVPDVVSPPDTGTPDFGFPDAFVPDMGTPDAFVPDTGRPDATVPDSGFPDATVPDLGVPDGFVPDFGFPDATVPDLGVPDGFVPDFGFPDATVPDLGFPDATVPDLGFPDGAVPDSGVPCPLGCSALDDACNVGVCAADGVTCIQAPRPDGTACDDNVDCTDSACVMGACVGTPVPPPPGDTCTTPITLNVTPGGQSQTGSNFCATDATPASCSIAPGGRDLIYTATFTETRRIRLETVSPSNGAQYDTVLHAQQGVCGPSPMPVVPICDDDSGQGFLSLVDEVFTGGTWFFTVDAFSANARGNYELMVDVDPHDTCARPSVITVPALNQTNFFVGNTSGNANDFTANCAAGANAPDQVWELTLTQPTTLRFETVAPGAGQYDTALHVRSSTCAAGGTGVVACDDDGGQGTLSLIERTLPAGTHYVIVDGFGSASQGEYRLAVTRLSPLTPLTFPATGDARLPMTGAFASSGDFVEGIRTVMLNSVTRYEMNLQVTNNLTCGQAFFRVRLNGTQVGTFIVRPGDTTVTQSFSFSPIPGPNGRYNLRYELQNNIFGNCGTVSLPDNVSTAGLGN